VRDIEQLEKVQRRFPKRLRGMKSLSYNRRLLQLPVGFVKLGIAALPPRPSILLQNRFWSGVSQFR